MESIAHNKSTTGRTVIERALRAGLHAVQAGSPALAARIGERVMFRTARPALSPSEQSLLDVGEHREIDTRAGRLQAWSWGNGPVVVLVHGWHGRASQLGTFVPPLVNAGFRVVGFDAPGHGASPGTQSNILRFADAITDVIDTVRPVMGPAHAVIAHSMGAPATIIAMDRARRTPALGRGRAETDLPAQRFVFVAPPIDVRQFVRAFSERVELGRSSETALRQRIERNFAVRFDDLYAPDLARRMDAPLLLVHDENDREVPVAAGRALAAAWPGATFHATRGLGHLRVLRDTDVIRRVVRFLA